MPLFNQLSFVDRILTHAVVNQILRVAPVRQDGVFQRVLANLADFHQVFAHHLVFLEAGDDLTLRAAPDDVRNGLAHGVTG